MKTIIFSLMLVTIFSCRSTQLPLETVEAVDLEKYVGLWYEISHLPARFQQNCECTTAEYRMTEEDYILVINSCYNTEKEKNDKATGKAFVVPNTSNTKLKVQFQWPFKGDYWILKIGNDYEYAVVGEPGRKYLWIISRSKEMDEDLYLMIVSEMKAKNFPVENLIRTRHDCAE
jgi:apolipoprotein D and lipocalin family protein